MPMPSFVPSPLITLAARIETRPRALTSEPGASPSSAGDVAPHRALGPGERGSPGNGRGHAGSGDRPRHACGPARSDEPRAGHSPSGDLASGATAMVLPLPMRLASIDEVRHRRLALRILRRRRRFVLVDADLAPFIEAVEGDPPFVMLDALTAEAARLGGDRLERPADDPDALAVLQFTSGSTADPKGVMLQHRQVCANIDAIEEAAQFVATTTSSCRGCRSTTTWA